MATRDHRGFTVLEAILGMIVLGVLTTLAVPQYTAMRARGIDGTIAVAVRDIATSQEVHFASRREYSGDLHDFAGLVPRDVRVTLGPGNSGDLASSFQVHATHPGTRHAFVWVSDPVPGEPNLVVH